MGWLERTRTVRRWQRRKDRETTRGARISARPRRRANQPCTRVIASARGRGTTPKDSSWPPTCRISTPATRSRRTSPSPNGSIRFPASATRQQTRHPHRIAAGWNRLRRRQRFHVRELDVEIDGPRPGRPSRSARRGRLVEFCARVARMRSEGFGSDRRRGPLLLLRHRLSRSDPRQGSNGIHHVGAGTGGVLDMEEFHHRVFRPRSLGRSKSPRRRPSASPAAVPSAFSPSQSSEAAGLHLTLTFRRAARVRASAERNGVRIPDTRISYLAKPAPNEFILGFSALGEPTMREAVKRLARSSTEAAGTRGARSRAAARQPSCRSRAAAASGSRLQYAGRDRSRSEY